MNDPVALSYTPHNRQSLSKVNALPLVHFRYHSVQRPKPNFSRNCHFRLPSIKLGPVTQPWNLGCTCLRRESRCPPDRMTRAVRSVGQIYVWSSFNRWNRIIRDHDRAKEAASTWNWVIRSHGLFQARGGFFPCRPCLPALHFFCTFCTGLAHSAPANRKILRSMEDSSAKPFLPSVVRTSGVVSGS